MSFIFNPITVSSVAIDGIQTPSARISGNLPVPKTGGPSAPPGQPVYSGNEIFLYTASTAVAKNATNKLALFQTDGWQYAKSLPTDTGARGYVYTEEPVNIPNNPLGASLPSKRARCLAIEAACYSEYFNGSGQCTATVQWGDNNGAVGQIPADVWFSCWIFAPDEVTGDTRIFTGMYTYPANYTDANNISIPGYYVDRFFVGNEVRLTLSGSTPTTTVSAVSYSGGNTIVTLTDAIADATITFAEYKSFTKGWSAGKMFYATRSGYPATCANDGYVWDFVFNTTNRAGIDGQDVCDAAASSPCSYAHLGLDPAYTGCGSAVNTTGDGTQALGNNLSSTPAIIPNTWRQIKLHIDISGTNPNCSSGQLAYELWARSYGGAFEKLAEWYGGSTNHIATPVTLIPNFTDGMKAVTIPGTVGGSNKFTGNWFDCTFYIDDFCIASSEADLPVYSDIP